MQDLIQKDRQCGHGPAHTTHSRLFEISSFKSNSIYAFYWVFYSIFWNRGLRYQTYGYHFDMNQLYQCLYWYYLFIASLELRCTIYHIPIYILRLNSWFEPSLCQPFFLFETYKSCHNPCMNCVNEYTWRNPRLLDSSITELSLSTPKCCSDAQIL